jgi:hypothetical protein
VNLESSIMFRSGWQAVLPFGSSALIVVMGASCSSNDSADDLFRAPPPGAIGGQQATGAGPSGTTGGQSNAGGSSGGAGRNTGASGGSLASGGRAATAGGRQSAGGRSANENGGRGGRPGGGGRPGSGGTTSGGSSTGGQLSTGGAEAGTGGAPDPVDCDDDDPCTIDEPDTQGGCHYTPKCEAASECESAGCDSGTGECVIEQADDGATCDDGLVCSNGDACSAGQCTGNVGDVSLSNGDARDIPQGNAECSVQDPLIVDFTVAGAGTATAVELMLELQHPLASDLVVRLLHVDSNEEVVLFDGSSASTAALSGQYVFADDAPSFMDSLEDGQTLEPGRYAPAESLSVFEGSDFEGTWRLFVSDLCETDNGSYAGAGIVIERFCEEP